MKTKISLIIIVILIMFISPITNLLSILLPSDQQEVYINSLETENRYLKEEISKINELYNLKITNYELIYGQVITRDIFSYEEKVTINIGSEDKVELNDPVINNEGLIGKITKVNKTTSIVTLITNSILNISVKINETYGNFNVYKVSNLTSQEEYQVGDKVYTSGLTELNSDIFVGEVKEIKTINNSLETELILKARNLENFNYIGVVK